MNRPLFRPLRHPRSRQRPDPHPQPSHGDAHATQHQRRSARRRWWGPRVLAVLAAALAAAVTGPPRAWADPKVLALVPTVGDAITNATNAITGLLALLATFFLTLAGARYLTGGGDPSQVEQAKQALRNAGLGFILAMLAPLITDILKSIVGA
jgi:hypothetical protein